MKFPFTIVDLTHTLTPNVCSWNGSCGFRHEIKLDYDGCANKTQFRVQQIKMHSGIGTHMDAPSHCIPGGKSIADLDLTQLIAPSVVIDISAQSHERYSLTIEDVKSFEDQHGKIIPGCFIIVYTGWDKFWHEPAKYRNDHMFPSVSKEAAELLLDRCIVGLGIDTLSPDRPEDDFPVHQLILSAGKYIVENIANARTMPPVNAYTLALPIKTASGTEAPIRLIGLKY